MATILLSAAGSALGSGAGGSLLGLSGAMVGRAVGATIGRSIDQRILGFGSDVVETGKVDRFYIGGTGYGSPIKQIWGRMRVAGEVIWASRFKETRRTSSGGKGNPRPTSERFSYSVSIALSLCEGVALRIGRVWVDGVEISPSILNIRFYSGREDQLPDPKIEAVEGVGFAPSYRGVSYVVIEDLDLSRFGNRVPQFSFEVIRRAQPENGEEQLDLPGTITAVSLIPGSGEYTLATTPVHFNYGLGQNRSANVHSIHGGTDFVASLEQLTEELPLCQSVSLVVSWFGSDLRCSACLIQPKVEQKANDGVEMPWSVSGVNRQSAEVLPLVDGRPIYGGTPADSSVMEAITAIRNSGKEVMFYPFVLMDQIEGNGLPDPWSTSENQPVLPWRGRITLNHAPGRSGSTDQTTDAETEIEAFLGEARPEHFSHDTGALVYTGPQGWGYRRFILHYAHLCALSGGVDVFIIGSELRGLTQIRSTIENFPMVDALKSLAKDVKIVLGNDTKISYAADWSEYFGYHADGDVIFHLDKLWSDSNVDFIGIDNYMPISDWRDGPLNIDAYWGSIYDFDYLESNIAGGEGFEWYYDSSESELSQRRIPIEDESGGEHWIFRYKDLKGWWSNEHHNRMNGARATQPTDWIPGMKPIIFTEYGCAAIDKATNQPNRFLDAKSSESMLPRGSAGKRDDYIQMRYYAAMRRFWVREFNNPKAKLYEGSMVDFGRSHAWAWDARPFPDFPGIMDIWSDGLNYDRGHWLNGRSAGQSVASVVGDIVRSAGMQRNFDIKNLHRSMHGFAADANQFPRAKLQSLMLAFGFNLREKEGTAEFLNKSTDSRLVIESNSLAFNELAEKGIYYSRSSSRGDVGRIRLTYTEAEDAFSAKTVEAASPEATSNAEQIELKIQMTEGEANEIVDHWLTTATLMRETARFALPASFFDLAPGDRVLVEGVNYMIERVEGSSLQLIDAVKIESNRVTPTPSRGGRPIRVAYIASTPVSLIFLDLPLMKGDEVAQAPHVAISASPWQGDAAIWSSSSDSGFILNQIAQTPAIVGVSRTNLYAAPSGVWDVGSRLRVELSSGELSSASKLDVLNGSNLLAIGDGSPENWEVLQYSLVTTIGEKVLELSGFLRGLFGTDAVVPSVWPAGSLIVILDGSLPQIDVSLAMRGLSRNYRIGLLNNGYLNSGVVEISQSFNGLGLRPYSVSHLVARGHSGEEVFLSWIRRTRLDGDSWQSIEVPLGEDIESYVIIVNWGVKEVRRAETTHAFWIYTRDMQVLDGISGSVVISVAQQSAVFGVGPFRSVSL